MCPPIYTWAAPPHLHLREYVFIWAMVSCWGVFEPKEETVIFRRALGHTPNYAFSIVLETCTELFTVSHTHFSSDVPSEVGITVIIPIFFLHRNWDSERMHICLKPHSFQIILLYQIPSSNHCIILPPSVPEEGL